MMRIGLTVLLAAAIAIAWVGIHGAEAQAPPSFSFYIEDGKGVTGYDPGDRELAEMAFSAWSRESGGKLRFVRGERESSALIRVRWISAGEGQYGETERIVVGGRNGANVFISLPVNLTPPLSTLVARDRLLRDTIVYLTCVHELGHAVGLNHTSDFEDIMYSFTFGGDIVAYFGRYRDKLKSRADIANVSGLSAKDVAALKALY